jgi:hypothetical protein
MVVSSGEGKGKLLIHRAKGNGAKMRQPDKGKV